MFTGFSFWFRVVPNMLALLLLGLCRILSDGRLLRGRKEFFFFEPPQLGCEKTSARREVRAAPRLQKACVA